jgi:hypothetical protein
MRVLHLTEEGAVDDLVPICCFCSKVRDDRKTKAGKGPWIDLHTYAESRQVPLSHRFVFSHGYCPDCVAHFDERMAAYRASTAWDSLRDAARRLIIGAEGDLRKRSSTVGAVEDALSNREEANEAVC